MIYCYQSVQGKKGRLKRRLTFITVHSLSIVLVSTHRPVDDPRAVVPLAVIETNLGPAQLDDTNVRIAGLAEIPFLARRRPCSGLVASGVHHIPHEGLNATGRGVSWRL